MKKCFASLFLVLALVLSLAMPAFASSGLNRYEEDLLNHFISVLNQYSSVLDERNTGTTLQYAAEARNTLTNDVELDQAACEDLNNTIDYLVDYARSHDIQTKQDAGRYQDEIVAIANKTANKYGMTIYVEHSLWGIADVVVDKQSEYYDGGNYRDDDDGGGGKRHKKESHGDKNPVNQTGFDLTATAVVCGMLLASLGGGLALSRRKELNVSL